MQRRNFLLGLLSIVVLAPINALAALWNKPAFEAVKLNEAAKQLHTANTVLSADIVINAPDRAENGAIVQVEIKSNIAATESISILVENNPTPLIAQFNFSHGAEPFVVTRIKMAETSDVTVLVKAGERFFTNSKNVVVLENGCN